MKRMDIIRRVAISSALGLAVGEFVCRAIVDTSMRCNYILFAIVAIAASVLYLTAKHK